MWIVVADDLTGANATGVLLSRKGFQAATYLTWKDSTQSAKDYEVVSVSTNSRGMQRQEAYRAVADTVAHFKNQGCSFFSKRIDTTLRGNLGAEIDAMLDTLEGEALAIVVASFPSSGRISVGGYLLVNGIPLEKTDVAKDPKTPVHTSVIQEVIKGQSHYSLGYICLQEVLKGPNAVQAAILSEKEQGKRIIVIDATTEDEIEIIAAAVAETKLPVVAVDPGPFTAHLAKRLLGSQSRGIPGKKVFFTVGSVTQQTKRQLEELKLKYNPLLVSVSPEALLDEKERSLEIDRVMEVIQQGLLHHQVLGITTNGSEILNLTELSRSMELSEDQVARQISDGLAAVTARVLQSSHGLIGGLYTSGGDVTVAVCQALGAAGIAVRDEVLPLAAYGRVIEGAYDNLPIITKGGLVGDDMAMVTSVEYLLTKISNEYYSV